MLNTIVHAVADGPGHGDLAGQGFAAGLAPQRVGEDYSCLIGRLFDNLGVSDRFRLPPSRVTWLS